jgi:hypothetical protein
MDDAQQIDRLIEVMKQLKELEMIYSETYDTVILTLMLSLINATPVPNVTILGNNKTTMALA